MFNNRIKITLLFILSFLLSHTFVWSVYSVIMSNTKIETTDREFYKHDENIKLLIMGDSHSLAALDPAVIDNSFNFSSRGENYVGTYFKLLYILRHTKKKIGTIILPIDMHTFSLAQASRIEPSFYWVKYVNYLEWGKRKDKRIHYLFKFLQGKIFPYTENFEQLLVQIYESKSPLVPKRTKTFFQNRNKTSATQLRVKTHFEKKNYIDEDLLHYFTKTLYLCNSNGITIILIKYPLTNEYYKQAMEFIEIKEFYRKIESITCTIPDIVTLDFQRDYADKDFLFEDPNHLNEEGSHIFSNMVKHTIATLNKNQ